MFISRNRAAEDGAGRWLARASSRCASPRLAPPSHGFTLAEIVIGLTILAMITGTLFAIISTSVRAASDIERLQRESDSINRFVELLRQAFTTMPSTTTLELTVTERSDPVLQELTITGNPNCFGFGANPISYQPTIIGLRPDTVQTSSPETNLPRHTLSISREDLIPKTGENEFASQSADSITAPDEQGRYWMPLLPAVNSLTWKFYKQSDDTWLEEWSESRWPDLVEVNILMEGRINPIRAVFGVPTLSLRSASQRGGSSSSTTPSTPAASTPSAPSPGGGGSGPSPGGGGAGPSSGGGGASQPGGGGSQPSQGGGGR